MKREIDREEREGGRERRLRDKETKIETIEQTPKNSEHSNRGLLKSPTGYPK